MNDRSHGGRVSHEADVELAAGNAMGDMMAEQALPGVFTSGKTIKETAAWNDHNGKNLMLRFQDGSTITFMGEFRIEATQGLAPVPEREEELQEHGRQLMSGDQISEADWDESRGEDAAE